MINKLVVLGLSQWVYMARAYSNMVIEIALANKIPRAYLLATLKKADVNGVYFEGLRRGVEEAIWQEPVKSFNVELPKKAPL